VTSISHIIATSEHRKTSLLNILSGRVVSRGPLTIKSDIRLDNETFDPTRIEVRREIAFVAQDTSLLVTSTPREAIRFSAKLRLSRVTSEEAINAITERVITELGLTTCADTMVGGGLIKGISGGERKRTSVGVELVVVSVFLSKSL
jgi:ABC-type multidrug transport system ATPase subunit